MIKTCVYCGEEFEAKAPNRTICYKKECYNKRARAYYFNQVDVLANKKKPKTEKKDDKSLFSLDEKAKLCKDLQITYGDLQRIVDSCDSRKEAMKKINEFRRNKFKKMSERNADGVHVYVSSVGSSGKTRRHDGD